MPDASTIVPLPQTANARPAGRASAACGQRFFLALIVGLVWTGPAWWDARYLYGMAIWDAAFVVLWILDYRRLPSPHLIQVSRTWKAPVGLGASSAIALQVTQAGNIRIHAALLDDLPRALRPELHEVVVTIPPRGTAHVEYRIDPVARGDAATGRAYLRYQSSLHLAERRAVADLEQSVRVYPDLQAARKQTLHLIRSRQIEMERRLKRVLGLGREFESLRDHRDGDDFRNICWTATARRAKLVSKTYQAERSQSVWIVLDAGRLMLARTDDDLARQTKLDCAVGAALSLAQVALHSGDAIGLLAYGRRIQFRLPLGRGAPHLRALLEQLALVKGEMVEADHRRAALTLLSGLKRRCLIVWLTDFPETADVPAVIENAHRLAHRSLVLFIAIAHPALRQLAARRPGSPEEMYSYVVAKDMLGRRTALLRRLRENGALAMELFPGQLSSGLVNQYLQVKERGML